MRRAWERVVLQLQRSLDYIGRNLQFINIDRILLAPTPNGPSPAPFNILVVEDDPTLRRLYELKLRGWPMQPEIRTAGDGYEALICMGNTKPDLLIADLQMPGMDGFRMLHTISNAPELAGMAIVVVSGLDAEEVVLGGGVPDGIPVLPKPVPFDQLLAIAEQVAGERK
jgi:CheY-like chemotaxis protein